MDVACFGKFYTLLLYFYRVMLLQENLNITWVLLLGSVGMLLLCIGIVAFFLLYQKKLLQNKLQLSALETMHKEELLHSRIEEVEQERKRIARDLHDEIGTLFTLLSRKVEQMTLPASVNKYQAQIDEMRILADRGINTTRRIAFDILPPHLELFGLITALEDFCMHQSKSTDVTIDFTITTLKKEPDDKTSLVVFRIIQELVNNTLKYAQATQIHMELNDKNGTLNFTYRDDGKGFDLNDNINGKGLGLRSIDNRVAMINGKIETQTSPGKGLYVYIQIPDKN